MRKFWLITFCICSLLTTTIAQENIEARVKKITQEIQAESISYSNAKFLFEQWRQNSFAHISKEELNIIYKLCVDNVKKFPFVKYYALSKERRENLSPQTQKILKNKNFCLLLLTMGYCQKNTFAINYAYSIRDTALYKYFMDQVQICRRHHQKIQDKKLFTKDSRKKFNLLLKMLADDDCHKNYYKQLKMLKLTADEHFMRQLKDHPDYKKQILERCRQLIRRSRGKKHENFRLEVLSALYCELSSEREQLNWYIRLQRLNNISKSERQVIKKRIDDLKQKLNLH